MPGQQSKLRVLGGTGTAGDDVTAAADLPAVGGGSAAARARAAIKAAIESFGQVDAVGHRIVHGGTLYTSPVLVTREVRQRVRVAHRPAPLHQPKSLAALDAVSSVLPDTPAVACFDTAFHATIPDAAATYALPAEWRTRWTLRRYGFHGLSHSYVSRRAAAARRRRPHEELRVVTCHLGAGASLAAVHGGRSVDTTMGFTPLDGLVMATRSGSVDPGLVLWLEEHAHMPSRELAATLENRSGLLGLAGTGDMREVLARAAAGDERAVLGRDVYLHRLRGRDRLDGRRDGRPRRAGLHRRRRRELAEIRYRAAAASASSASPSTSHATPPTVWRATTGRSPPGVRGSARSSSRPARTSRSPPRSGQCCAESVESLVE